MAPAENQQLEATWVWDRFSDALRGFLQGQTGGDSHAAEDLLQECFLRVHDGLAGLREQGQLGPWLQRIAQRLVIDWRRARGNSLESRPAADELAEAELAQAPEAGSSLDAVVASWLAPAILKLDVSYRDALRLTEIEGLSQAQAAERLGLSLAALKSRVLRGRQKLRASILACCQLEFDSRGGILDYRRRSSSCGGCD